MVFILRNASNLKLSCQIALAYSLSSLSIGDTSLGNLWQCVVIISYIELIISDGKHICCNDFVPSSFAYILYYYGLAVWSTALCFCCMFHSHLLYTSPRCFTFITYMILFVTQLNSLDLAAHLYPFLASTKGFVLTLDLDPHMYITSTTASLRCKPDLVSNLSSCLLITLALYLIIYACKVLVLTIALILTRWQLSNLYQ
jgi:hypothetical protein